MAGCSDARSGATSAATTGITLPGTTGVVTWISDGDTIDVETADGTITVRLVANNAPDRDECYADVGLDHLIDTLKGQTVRLETSGIDQFDRILAHVFVGERHVNLEMVESGMSLASTPDGGDPYGEQVLAAEEQAFRTGSGLWAPDACGSHGDLPELAFDPGASSTDPRGADDEYLSDELVGLVNEDDETLDLSGWRLRDESTRHRYTFPDGTMLSPGAAISVASSDPGWVPGGEPVWNNGGDLALIQLPDGTVVDRWRY